MTEQKFVEDDGGRSGKELYSNVTCLAPMVRAGSLPFRMQCLGYGADLVWSEEIIDKRLLKCERMVNEELGTVDYFTQKAGNKKQGEHVVLFRTCAEEKSRIVLQLGTSDPSSALQAAKLVEQDVAAIDINMGCPKRFSVQAGMGAALLGDVDTACAIIKTVRGGCSLPVSAKMRLLDGDDPNAGSGSGKIDENQKNKTSGNSEAREKEKREKKEKRNAKNLRKKSGDDSCGNSIGTNTNTENGGNDDAVVNDAVVSTTNSTDTIGVTVSEVPTTSTTTTAAADGVSSTNSSCSANSTTSTGHPYARTVAFMMRLIEAGVSAITVHLRTRYDSTTDVAKDGAVMKLLVDAIGNKVPLLANGDLYTPIDIFKMRHISGCSGVMLARPALLNPAEAFFKPDQLWHPISGGEISDRRRSLVRWFVDEETHLTPTYKTTTLMEVMKDFLRYCIRYRPVYQVAKYTLQEMMLPRRHPPVILEKLSKDGNVHFGRFPEYELVTAANSFRELCDIFNMADECDASYNSITPDVNQVKRRRLKGSEPALLPSDASSKTDPGAPFDSAQEVPAHVFDDAYFNNT